MAQFRQARRRIGGSESDLLAATLHQRNISPDSCQTTDTLARSHDSEPAFLMQMDTGVILREDAGLQCPYAFPFRGLDERGKQSHSDAFATGTRPHINAYFGHAGIHLTAGDAAEGSPSECRRMLASNQPAPRQMGGVPALPLRSGGFERGVAGGDALQIDGANLGPVGWKHWFDRDCLPSVGHGHDYRIGV